MDMEFFLARGFGSLFSEVQQGEREEEGESDAAEQGEREIGTCLFVWGEETEDQAGACRCDPEGCGDPDAPISSGNPIGVGGGGVAFAQAERGGENQPIIEKGDLAGENEEEPVAVADAGKKDHEECE